MGLCTGPLVLQTAASPGAGGRCPGRWSAAVWGDGGRRWGWLLLNLTLPLLTPFSSTLLCSGRADRALSFLKWQLLASPVVLRSPDSALAEASLVWHLPAPTTHAYLLWMSALSFPLTNTLWNTFWWHLTSGFIPRMIQAQYLLLQGLNRLQLCLLWSSSSGQLEELVWPLQCHNQDRRFSAHQQVPVALLFWHPSSSWLELCTSDEALHHLDNNCFLEIQENELEHYSD